MKMAIFFLSAFLLAGLAPGCIWLGNVGDLDDGQDGPRRQGYSHPRERAERQQWAKEVQPAREETGREAAGRRPGQGKEAEAGREREKREKADPPPRVKAEREKAERPGRSNEEQSGQEKKVDRPGRGNEEKPGQEKKVERPENEERSSREEADRTREGSRRR